MKFKNKNTPFYTPCQEIPLNKMDKWRYLDMTTRARLKSASWRVFVVGFIFLGLFCVILGRLFQLTVMDYHGRDYTKKAISSSYALKRYNILDRNGIFLASSVPTTDLSVNPALVKGDAKEIAKNIANALNDVDEKDVYSAITSSAGFKYIKRKLSPAERQNINWLGYYFLSEFPGEYRTYPHRNLVSHLLGGVDIDNVGISGIEKAYDQQLIHENVQLSIDVSIQEMVHNALTQGIEKFKAQAGLAIVMDVNNGEVLASVSLPDYNPNFSPKGKTGKERFNQATLGTYEFGSIFKLFNTALGLESKTITTASIFDTSEPLKIGRKRITDYRGQERPLTVPEILIHSSNIGSAQIGLKIGQEKQKEFLGRFGFYEKLPIPLPERGTTQYNKKEKWADMESATISYGYGISVTPLHLIAGVASLANGGLYRVPTFIKNGNKDQVETRVLSESVSKTMRHLMWGVVNYELPENSPVAPYAVGGKTGSANLIENGRYVEGKLRTTFVGMFPMNDPKYIVLVSYTDPKKVKATHMFNAAGWNAKATGLQIIGEIAPYLGVEPIESWEQPNYILNAFERSREAKKGKKR